MSQVAHIMFMPGYTQGETVGTKIRHRLADLGPEALALQLRFEEWVLEMNFNRMKTTPFMLAPHMYVDMSLTLLSFLLICVFVASINIKYTLLV
jgi:hypothetical protein